MERKKERKEMKMRLRKGNFIHFPKKKTHWEGKK